MKSVSSHGKWQASVVKNSAAHAHIIVPRIRRVLVPGLVDAVDVDNQRERSIMRPKLCRKVGMEEEVKDTGIKAQVVPHVGAGVQAVKGIGMKVPAMVARQAGHKAVVHHTITSANVVGMGAMWYHQLVTTTHFHTGRHRCLLGMAMALRKSPGSEAVDAMEVVFRHTALLIPVTHTNILWVFNTVVPQFCQLATAFQVLPTTTVMGRLGMPTHSRPHMLCPQPPLGTTIRPLPFRNIDHPLHPMVHHKTVLQVLHTHLVRGFDCGGACLSY